MDIDAVVQEKIDNDTDFQATLEGLSDEDKATTIATRRSEMIKEEFDSLNKRASENEQKFKDQQIRAEKAEKELKNSKPPANPAEESKTELSEKDRLAIIRADIHEDDLDDVLDFAKFKKISVSEALKNATVKATIAEKVEQRKSAEATSTTTKRPSVAKVSDDALMKGLSKGDVPEKGTDEAERLFWARRGGKK